MLIKRLILLLGITSVFGSAFTPCHAIAWAHKQAIATDFQIDIHRKSIPTHRNNLLLFKILKGQNIYYCTSTEDEALVNADSLAMQTSIALKVWKTAFSKVSFNPKVVRTQCNDPRLNLRIREINSVRVGSEDVGNSAYESEDEGSFSSVTIVRDVPNGRRGRKLKDFKKYLPPNFREALEGLIFRSILSGDDYARETGRDVFEMLYSTYPTLLHEIGHAFGLDDTYVMTIFLDAKHSSPGEQPSSVMKEDQIHLNITQDDIDGIVSLYQRFKNNFPVFESVPTL